MKLFTIVTFIVMSNIVYALDSFNNVRTAYYAKVEVTNGITPRVFDMYFDGNSKTALVGPPPRNSKSNLKMLGDTTSMECFIWTDNDPKETILSVNYSEMAKAIGVDPKDVKSKGSLIGNAEYLGESCEHWRLEVNHERNGKIIKQTTESCIAKDGIQLWGKVNGTTVSKLLMLKRGKQDIAKFEFPKNYKIVDLSKLVNGFKK